MTKRAFFRVLILAWTAMPGGAATAHPPASPPEAPSSRPAAAPVRTAPTRPAAQLWAFTKLQGADYVSLHTVAARYGMKLAWPRPLIERTLADPRGVRFAFERNQRDCHLDGVRVFLGAPVLLHKE
ncbi:MAG TPA: hypothetical protein VHN79_14720 [Lacunisphaera sp.]|nr:hypothetical protein [Lacunisphaera sp.]